VFRLPKQVMLRESGRMMSRIMRMVVVLPAPLGPSKPYTDPRGTWSDRSRTATCSSYRFTTLRMSIARSDMDWEKEGGREPSGLVLQH
jgi:hypothetical protein